ncbi:MAG: ArsR family transcriptional regulator [Propionibacteriaceae bacterium]|jgi:predicted nucleotidyltransferase|nr:ArsR family transcriptional regulator [Propionibacteriaceae bacterium]
MRVVPPALLPILRSGVQGKVLATVYLAPEREFSVSKLAQYADASLRATAQEVERLVTAGLLADRRSGNQRLVRRPAPNRIITPLTELLTATYGPLPVLTEELADVAGVKQAFIYGSWAARDAGSSGGPPDDVDVMVIGTPTLDDLDDVAERATSRLNRAVNIRRLESDYWADPPDTDTFVATIKRQPLTAIPLANKE